MLCGFFENQFESCEKLINTNFVQIITIPIFSLKLPKSGFFNKKVNFFAFFCKNIWKSVFFFLFCIRFVF